MYLAISFVLIGVRIALQKLLVALHSIHYFPRHFVGSHLRCKLRYDLQLARAAVSQQLHLFHFARDVGSAAAPIVVPFPPIGHPKLASATVVRWLVVACTLFW